MADIVITNPVISPSDPCANHQTMVNNYIAAETAVLSGQSVQWGDRRLSRTNLTEIRNGRKEWEAKLQECRACQSGANRSRFGGLRTSLADLSGGYSDE